MPEKEFGLARTSKLVKPAQYRRVFHSPIKTTDRCFTVLCRPGNLATPRLGLAVSKKFARRAIDRNRIKRVIRESFRCNKVALGGIDFVVLNRKGADSMSNSALFDSLSHHWNRLQQRADLSNS